MEIPPQDSHAPPVALTPTVASDQGARETPAPPIANFLGIPGVTREGAIAFGTVLGYLLLYRLTLLMPFSQVTVVGATLVLLVLELVFTVMTARAMNTQRALTINTLAAAVFALPYVLIPILATRFPYWSGWVPIGASFVSYKKALAHLPGLHGLMLIWLAICVGVWLSRLLREMKVLLPIAVVLACVDLYVVFGGGLVTQAATGKAPVAAAAMATLTVHHPTSGAAPMELSVGFADYLFIALFFACFARFNIRSRYTFVVLCLVLVSYLFAVYVSGVSLPALVPIAVVVIGMNLRAFRYARSELFAMLYAAVIVAAILGGLVYFSHHK